jgi:hypothetical protein
MTFYREMMAMTFYRELSQTFGSEPAGDLTIKTGKLIVQDGAQVSADTFSQGDGGKLTVLASDSVELSGKSTLADGREVQSGLFSVASDPDKTGNIGDGGDLTVQTGRLIVRNGAGVAVSRQVSDSGNERKAGNLEIAARSIQLNRGFLSATTHSGKGGNITLQVQDLLILRHASQISTSAGTRNQGGDGGNININSQFLAALPSEDSELAPMPTQARAVTSKSWLKTFLEPSLARNLLPKVTLLPVQS